MFVQIACLLAVGYGAADLPAAPAAPKGPAELQGTWKLVSVEVNGKPVDVTDQQPRWVIRGDKVRYGGEEIASLAVDAKAAPKIIDLSFLSPKRAYEGIYAVEKDKLKVCVNKQTDGVKERPDGFSTKDKENWRLLVFERDKAAKGEATEGLSGYVGVALRFYQDQKEVAVSDLIDGAPAKKAGLRKGDVVLKVGDAAVTDLRSAIKAVQQAKPGTKVTFRVRRDGKERDVTVKAGVLPFTWRALLE
jgi:uncharacterized protein (TIGR03067 family)